MAILIRGTKFSSRFNQVVVAIKLAVVAAVIVVGVAYVDPSNWVPFIPESQPVPEGGGGFEQTPLITSLLGIEPAVFGLGGVIAGAAIVFFAFIGFDIVATTAEEAKNPQKDVPVGILGSLLIVTVLYAAVSLIVTGMQSYKDIDPEDAAPLATAFSVAGVDWMGDLISVGACIGLVVVAMILMLGQSRVAFAMGRDGLLPRSIAKVHPTFGTPYRITLITGVVVAVIAGFVDLTTLADLVNIGTLFAFILVSIGVVVLRRTRPDLERAFRVRAVWSGGHPRHAHVPLPDAEPQGRDLGPVPGLDGDRLRRLLRLRTPAQPARSGRAPGLRQVGLQPREVRRLLPPADQRVGVLDPVRGDVDDRVEHQRSPCDGVRRGVRPVVGVGAEGVVEEDRVVDDRVTDRQVLPVEEPEPVGRDQDVLVPRVAVDGGMDRGVEGRRSRRPSASTSSAR